MDSSQTELLIIGAGPGGYAAAFHAADLGMHVTLIDKQTNPGGVCLYRGCIPSKALLHVAKVIADAREAKEFGVNFTWYTDLNKIRAWKDSIVTRLTGGLGQLCRQRKINYIQGTASLLNSMSARVVRTSGTEEIITFQNAILATGSVSSSLPFAPQSQRIMYSTGALNLDDVPGKLLIVGGGYIGLELGTVYSELGSTISVVELMPSLLPGVDSDLSQILTKRLKTRFAAIKLETKVIQLGDSPEGITVTYQYKTQETSTETFDKVLMAIGRKPTSEGLGLAHTKVTLDEKGFVIVNPSRQTADPAIYAIGDIAGEPMLAHKAAHEGRIAVEAIRGHKVAFEPKAIPAVVFTDPEVAWCGLTETQAKSENREIKVAKFPWGASGRAATLNRSEGLTKLIIDPKSQRLLGVAIVGQNAGEMIAEGVLAVEMGATAEDVKLSIHPHPTLSETLMEAAESVFGQSTHFLRPKK